MKLFSHFAFCCAVFAVCLSLLVSCGAVHGDMEKRYSDSLCAESVIAATDAAVSWQIREYPYMNAHRRWLSNGDISWENAIFMTSVTEWSYLRGDTASQRWVREHALASDYRLGNGSGISHVYHADHLIAGMWYAALYEQDGDERVLIPTYERLEFIKNHPSTHGMAATPEDSTYEFKKRWSWCDALYMAPQVFARYALLMNDSSLLSFMDREYWASTEFLYSPAYHLYWRDSNYFDQLEHNGKPVFWGRGNGWVVAGLAKMLPYLPSDWSPRERYIALFREMMRSIVALQSAEGHWHVSLLDPSAYPAPEMSSTGFFCYALWWGINNGYLEKTVYLQPAIRAWKSLVHAMQPDGMLGYVQAVGEKPESVTAEMTEVYGPAAMVYAAMEILKYLHVEE